MAKHRRRRKFWEIGPHHLIVGVILIVALTIAIRLILWNRGSVFQIDPSSVDSYDVEVQDQITPMDPALLAEHPDDGVTRILFLGNDPLSDDLGDTGLAAQIAEMEPGVETITAAFPGSRIAVQNFPYSQADLADIFNFYYIADAAARQDYTGLEIAASYMEDPRFAEAVKTLKATDFDTVDMIVVFYDIQDYRSGSPVMNEGNPDDILTYTGSMKLGFFQLQQRYPHIRIVFLSPTYAKVKDADGSFHDSSLVDLGNGTLATYWTKAIDICSFSQVSFLDNYYGSVNADNYASYLDDETHLNSLGRRAVARHFVHKILRNEKGEYDISAADRELLQEE